MAVLLVLDTETTGLDPTDAAVVEVACVAVAEGAIVAEWSSLVWPGREFLQPRHREVLRDVSGIGLEELLDAPDAREACLGWSYDLAPGLTSSERLLTSFNIAFDRPMLETHLQLGLVGFEWAPCVMATAAAAMGIWKGRVSLASACAHFGISQEPAHRALADARAAARLAVKLGLSDPQLET